MGIHIFNSTEIEIFSTNRFAALIGPLDAAIDGHGRTVFLNRIAGRGHELQRLDLYGEPDAFSAESLDNAFDPQHLIVTRDGNYLSLDSDTGIVVKHDSASGRLLWVRHLGETNQAKSGSLHLGRPVEAADGRIAIPGGELRRILILAANGEVITTFGRFGSAPGRLVFPVAAAFGPNGTLLVLDRMRHKILVYGNDYGFVNEFGSLGSNPGQLYHPVAMAASDDGRLFVAQGFQGRVQVFNILSDEDY